MNPKEHAPCYIYDQAMIESACEELKKELPGFTFLYSIKANPFEPVVRTIASHGFGADAASWREVEESLTCGMTKEQIYFSAPGKSEQDLRNARGKCTIIADSLNELRLIQKIAEEHHTIETIGLRVHPLYTMGAGAVSASKFGVDLEQIDELKETLKQCPNIRIAGMHVHLRSQVLDAETIGQYYEDTMKTALLLKETCGIDMKFINFGSGIGTVYDAVKEKPVDLAALREKTAVLMEMNAGLGAKLIIETGRFVVCRAGKYVTPVIDKKVSHGTTYLIVANGLNGFLRPAIAALIANVAKGQPVGGMEPLFTNDNEFEIKVLNNCEETETVNVVGNLCTALDVIKNNITLNKAEPDDLIEISNAGSYAYPLTPVQFSSHTVPEQYLETPDGKLIEH